MGKVSGTCSFICGFKYGGVRFGVLKILFYNRMMVFSLENYFELYDKFVCVVFSYIGYYVDLKWEIVSVLKLFSLIICLLLYKEKFLFLLILGKPCPKLDAINIS